MKASFAALVLCLGAANALAKTPLKDVKASSPDNSVPSKYIIEVANAADVPSKRDAEPHAAVYESLKKRKVGYTVDKEFKDPLFNGASIVLEDPNDLTELENTPGVVSVRPVRQYARPNPAKRDIEQKDKDAADTQSTHVITHVDKLHAEGLLGQGVIVGIIDTGTDYTHPYLGGGFGPNYLVAGGHDFVGDAYTGSNTPVPDNDPLDQCAGHGTHVAGIVAAQPGNEYNITGVAYKSTLYSYRIFGCAGGTQDDVIIEALIRGYNDGADVITLSLGGPDGWTEGAASVVATRIAALGKIVTIAAGNEGAYGGWYTSSPGNGLGAISVASTDNTVIGVQTVTVSGDVAHAPIPYNSLVPLPIPGTLKVYATSLDSTVADDACAPLPAGTPDLSDYVVLIRRGTCAFTQKLGNAAAKGAKYFLIYNNVPGLASISVGNYTAALIPAEDGTWLVSQLAAGKNVELTFPQTGGYAEYPDPNGGLVSDFSTYGPTFDMYFKPAVAAPGGNILSTYPTTKGSWAVLSGTSMATPFIAGVSSLLLQAKGKSLPVATNARNLFETTAQPVASSHNDSALYQTLSQQGAGLIDAYKAIHTTTFVTPGELLLNDTAHFKKNQDFHITNSGKTVVTYEIGHVAAGTATTFAKDQAIDYPVPLVSNAATVKFSRTSVTLLPGSSAKITATFTPPTGLDASTLPVYSGWVTIISSAESLQIPYLGTAAALKDKQVLDSSDYYFGVPLPAILDAKGDVQTAPTNYTFANGDYPSLLFRLTFGTAKFNVDLVSADTNFTPTIAKRASDSAVETLGSLASYDYVPRNTDGDANANGYSLLRFTEPVFANGTAIPKGSYKALVRALRVTGNPSKEGDYDSWLSPLVRVV